MSWPFSILPNRTASKSSNLLPIPLCRLLLDRRGVASCINLASDCRIVPVVRHLIARPHPSVTVYSHVHVGFGFPTSYPSNCQLCRAHDSLNAFAPIVRGGSLRPPTQERSPSRIRAVCSASRQIIRVDAQLGPWPDLFEYCLSPTGPPQTACLFMHYSTPVSVFCCFFA